MRPVKQFAAITVIGRDKTGVIARVTGFLFERGANIEALEEQVTRGRFSMTIQASWPVREWDADRLRDELKKLAASIQMEITLSFIDAHRRQRFAIMVTRETHAFDAVLAACRAGQINAEPAIVVSNQSHMAPLARKHGLPFLRVSWEDRAKAEEEALTALEKTGVDFVVLARFMKILSPNFVWRHKNKIINIHPSLLPSFPGPQAYRQAYERGVKIIGVTAHFVTMHLDEGPIIAQGSFPVRGSMTLKDIVAAGQKLESNVLIKAIKLYLSRRLDVYWGIVKEV